MGRYLSDVLSWVFTSTILPANRKSCSSPYGPRHDCTASKVSSRGRSTSRRTRSSPTRPMIFDWLNRSLRALSSRPCQRSSRLSVTASPVALSFPANWSVALIKSEQSARKMANCSESSSVRASLQPASPIRSATSSMPASLGRADGPGTSAPASKQNTYRSRTSLANQ